MERIRRELPDEFPGSNLYFQPADIVSQVLNFGLSAPSTCRSKDRTSSRASGSRASWSDASRDPGASDVRIPQILAHPALAVDVDRARAAQIGVTERDVANNLLVSLSSSSLVAPSFLDQPEEHVNYPSWCRRAAADRLGAFAARHSAGPQRAADQFVASRRRAGGRRLLSRGGGAPAAGQRPGDDQPRFRAAGSSTCRRPPAGRDWAA